MDHKVSKDMISSGMTPSGEKTQADLGRTQYGSAPSPSKLMDAYKSMYKEESDVPKMTDSQRRYFAKRDQADDDMIRARQQDKIETAKNSPQAQKIKSDKIKKARETFRTGQRQENIDLLAAYRAVHEHHKKDADGNTIPHEDEEVNEGKIPAGLQAYLDKKKGKKEDKKDMKEEVDKFDVIFNHFISEGYSEKEAYAKMSNLTEEQLDEFLKALAQAGMRGAQSIGKKTQGLAARAAQQGANLGQKKPIDVISPVKRKPFDPQPTPRKPFDAKKPEPKMGDDNFRAKTASDVVTAINMKRKKEREITPNKGQVMQDEYQYIDEYAAALAKGVAMLSKAAKPIMKIAQKPAVKDTVKNIVTQTAIGSAMSGGNQKKQTTGTVSASADLFDIVKGQLLDEGLSEEEIKDIMLTLTPDEILNEISVGKMADYISAADKDVQKTANDMRKGKPVISADDSRVKKISKRAEGMALAGTKIAKKLTPPSMP